MEWRKISSGSLRNLSHETWEYSGEYVHIVKILGTVGKEERLPFVRETLKLNSTGNYFCIFDNRNGHDSVITYDQLMLFGDMFRDAGIRRLYNVSVTSDESIAPVNRLMEAVADTRQILAEVLSTADYREAVDFVNRKIAEVTAGK